MDKLFSDGTVVTGILCLMGVEAAVLLALRTQLRRRSQFIAVLGSLGAGAALLMGFNAALQGARWQVLGQWLALALIFHVVDLVCRFVIPLHEAGSRYEH
jgi:predicted lysophospholipase L1 biosynthesis ABC-type transport system permease subunit